MRRERVAAKHMPAFVRTGLAALIGAALLPIGPAASQPSDGRRGFETMIDKAQKDVASVAANPDVRGTGPFPATIERDLAMPDVTIYRPADLVRLGSRKLGLVIWGNGGCVNDGASAYKYLAEVASHGYLVIAPGKPLSGPLAGPGVPKSAPMTTTVPEIRAMLDWALAENGRRGSPYYQRLDPRMIAAAGHSCGAMQAMIVADDPRIQTVVINNSSLMPAFPDRPPMIMSPERLKGLRQPTVFFMGGESDIVWKYAVATFEQMQGTPVVFASRDYGHGGTFDAPHGGEVAKLTVAWLEWQLRGDRSAGVPFAGSDCGLCKDPAWTVRKKGIR